MKKLFKQMVLMLTSQFTDNPYQFWAKALDKVVHIPENKPGGFNGTLCGSVAALLGNNYAPSMKPVFCKACMLKKYYQAGDYIMVNNPDHVAHGAKGFITGWQHGEHDYIEMKVGGGAFLVAWGSVQHIPIQAEVDVLRLLHTGKGTPVLITREMKDGLYRKGWLQFGSDRLTMRGVVVAELVKVNV